MRIAILGAGAMGCLLASYLCGHAEVWLIDSWQQQIDTIAHTGLLREVNGIQTQHQPQATCDATEPERCDIAIVLVKSHQTPWAAEQATILDAPFVITLQNGVGNHELLAKNLGAARAGQAVTSLGATLLGPGHVRHAGMGITSVGRMPQPELAQAFVDLLASSGLPAERSDNLDTLVWGKLIVNVGINALTALLRVPNGMLDEIPQAQALLRAAVAEAEAVAAAQGIVLPYNDAIAHVRDVVRATAANRSSMLQDVLRGSPTEIHMINGAVARIGEQLGIPTPVNRILTELVSALDASSQ